MIRKLTILGPGLLGGSIGLAARQRKAAAKVAIWARRPEAADQAFTLGAADEAGSDLRRAVADAELIVLATPLGAMPALASQIAPLVSPECVVTDVGSVKYPIVTALSALFPKFVGSHPMAGSEQSGISAARPDLFDGTLCLLTPSPASCPEALEKVRRLWKDAGCALREMSAIAHDRSIARLSHLPHAAAAALVHAATRGGEESPALAGNGYRDSTRVAGGSEGLWAEILLDNPAEIVPAITDLQSALEELKSALVRGDRRAVEGFLARARALRSNEKIPPA